MTAPELDVFKDIVASDEIDDQIMALLQTWMPTYKAEVLRQRGISDPVPDINSYVSLQDFRHDPENQTPAIVLVNAGTSGRPTKNGEGYWRATWVVAISVITSTKDRESTNRMSKIYSAAVRAIMLQKRAGGGLVTSVEWLGETPSEIDRDAGDMLAAATNTFEIESDGLVKDRGAGPAVPSIDPPSPVPVVRSGVNTVTVTQKED